MMNIRTIFWGFLLSLAVTVILFAVMTIGYYLWNFFGWWLALIVAFVMAIIVVAFAVYMLVFYPADAASIK